MEKLSDSSAAARASWRGVLSLDIPTLGLGAVEYHLRATGPKGHTIEMTIKARDKGLVINSKGLWTREEPQRLIRTKTEADVGRILGWKLKPPEARGKGSKLGSAFD